MGHSHTHSHSHDHAHSQAGAHAHTRRALGIALCITVVFLVIEAVGGFLSGSLALLSDAAHLLTDVGALSLGLFSAWIASKPRSAQMTFGYQRAEILGALLSGLAIWLLAGMIIWEAIGRMGSPPEVKGPMVFGIALIGLIANLVSMRFLHPKQEHSLNVRAAYLHLWADALSSVGAVIAGAVIWTTGWSLIDPLISLFFSIVMLWNSFGLVKETVAILMEATPRGIDSQAVDRDLRALGGVLDVHDLHIWSLSTGRVALSVHLSAPYRPELLSSAQALLKNTYAIEHSTIQIEPPEPGAPCVSC